MAKWDLSKLPEGRKPLPDEWFAERAQMQEWIKELEDRLAKALAEMRNVDAYLTKLQAPGTEPLNSVNAATSKADRNIYTAMVRNEAREAWASLGNTLAELTGGETDGN